MLLFRRHYPDGWRPILASIRRAMRLGLSVEWHAKRVCTAPAWRAYEKAKAPALRAYEEAKAPALRDAYQEAAR